MASGSGTRNRLRHLRARPIAAKRDLAQRAADAGGNVNRGSSASTQPAKRKSVRTKSVRDRASPTAASALCHVDIIAKIAISADMDTIEPSLIEVLAGLNVKTNSNGIGPAHRIAGGTSAVAAAKVLNDLLARDEDASKVAVTVMVPIPILILRHGNRPERRNKKNDEDGHDARCAALISGESGMIHCTPLIRRWPSVPTSTSFAGW